MSRTIRNRPQAHQGRRVLAEGWEIVKAARSRIDVMPSRTHGEESNRTARRKARQSAQAAGGWAE